MRLVSVICLVAGAMAAAVAALLVLLVLGRAGGGQALAAADFVLIGVTAALAVLLAAAGAGVALLARIADALDPAGPPARAPRRPVYEPPPMPDPRR